MSARARILVVDDNDTMRAMLIEWLRERYDVRDVSSGKDALEVLTHESFAMLLSDINMPGMNGFELLREVRKRYPALKTALITDYNVDTYIRYALEHDITNIIVKNAPFDANELFRTVENLLQPELVWGLAKYLDAGTKIDTQRLTASDQTEQVREAVLAASPWPGAEEAQGNTLRMVFEEIASNALYHAYGYKKFERVQLKPDQVVEIDWGADKSKVGFAVRDYSGRLTKDVVLRKILRAMSPEGVLDTEGRGLFLTRSFSDRFILNIHPGVRTEIIVLKYFVAPEDLNRPLYINQI